MSRNVGTVVFQKDQAARYFKFNSTVEECDFPKLFPSPEAVWENWHNYEWPICTCGCEPELVTVYPYDDSPMPDSKDTISWNGTACRHCNCIVKIKE